MLDCTLGCACVNGDGGAFVESYYLGHNLPFGVCPVAIFMAMIT